MRGWLSRERLASAGLFPNTAHPDKSDFNGQIEVECAFCGKQTSFWINGWRKVTRAGGKYLSLSLRPKRVGEHGRAAPAPAANARQVAVADDDL